METENPPGGAWMAQEANHCPGCWRKLPVMEAGQRPNFCPHCQFPMKRIAGVYELEARVGAGAFGTVYRCRHVERDTFHAVKIMRWDVVDGLAPLHWDLAQKRQKQAEFEQRFQREVQLTRALAAQSWHIVHLEDAGSDPVHGLYYVMELLEGTSLTAFLEQWPGVARRLAFSIMQQICEGVSAAHKMGVIHRDIKPENLMLLRQEHAGKYVKILDFGIAKVLGSPGLKLTSRPVGTPLYMAPEQCANRDIDQRTDIYALGCLFYHLITGSPPFGEELDVPQLMLQHVHTMPLSLRERCPTLAIPEGLDRVVMRSLQKSPGDRYGSVDEFWAALSRYAHLTLAPPPEHEAQVWGATTWAEEELWGTQKAPSRPPRDISVEEEFHPKNTAEMIQALEGQKPHWGVGGVMLVLLFLGLFGGILWLNRQPSTPGRVGKSGTSKVTSGMSHTTTEKQRKPSLATISAMGVVRSPLTTDTTGGGIPLPVLGEGTVPTASPKPNPGDVKQEPRLSRLEKFLRQAVLAKQRQGSGESRGLVASVEKRSKPSSPRSVSKTRGARRIVPVIGSILLPKVAGWPVAHERKISPGRLSLSLEHPISNNNTIPAGNFTPQGRTFSLSHGFWIWRTEVTQGHFRAMMGYNPSSFQKCGANCPVENVSWHEAAAFTNALSLAQHLGACFECTGQGKHVWCMVKKEYWGRQYTRCKGWRLPSEAEWEFAYRAGSAAPYTTGKCMSAQQANFNGQQVVADCPSGPFRKRTLPVASFPPNGWGLYDMAGNVWEWVYDSFSPTLPTGNNPVRIGSSQRVVRGGGWYSVGKELQATARDSYGAEKRGVILGFRPVRTR